MPPHQAIFVAGADRPKIRPPQTTTLFAQRAARCDALAPQSAMSDWLRFIGRLARQQDLGAHRFGDQAADLLAQATAAKQLQVAKLISTRQWHALLHFILEGLRVDAPAPLAEAIARLLARSSAEQADIATLLLNGEVAQPQLAEATLLGGAIELAATLAASAFQCDKHHAVATHCPCCNGAPVASVLTPAGSGGDGNLRYLVCGTCNTEWHHVRTQCVHCGHGGQLVYSHLDERPLAWRAETCTACGTYLKLFLREHTADLDPVADDLASLDLDLALGQEGLLRRGANLFLQFAVTAPA